MRYVDILETGIADYTPYFLRDFTLGMDIVGLRTTDVYTPVLDPVKSAESICAFQRYTGQDAVIGCTHSAAFLIEQFGGSMRYPSDGIPVPVSRPFSEETDFSSISMEFGEQMRSAFTSYKIVKDRMFGIADVVGNITGPLTKASVLAGVDNIALMMKSDPDVLSDLLRFCTDFTGTIIDKMISDESVDSFLIAAATDNPDLFGFDDYEKFSMPYTSDICHKIKNSDTTVVYHPHGIFVSEKENHSDLILGMGIDGYHFAEGNDPKYLLKVFKDKMCLVGGTDIIPTLMSDSQKVTDETETYLDIFSGTEYIFAASCSLHRGISLDNIKAMCDAVKNRRNGY